MIEAAWLLNRNLGLNDIHGKPIRVLKGDFLGHVDNFIQENMRFKAIYSNPPLKTGNELVLSLFQSAL